MMDSKVWRFEGIEGLSEGWNGWSMSRTALFSRKRAVEAFISSFGRPVAGRVRREGSLDIWESFKAHLGPFRLNDDTSNSPPSLFFLMNREVETSRGSAGFLGWISRPVWARIDLMMSPRVLPPLSFPYKYAGPPSFLQVFLRDQKVLSLSILYLSKRC